MRFEGEETTLYDEPDFLNYVQNITDILSVARFWDDGRPKGYSVGEIHAVLGEVARPDWTSAALSWASVQEDIGAIMRYRL